MHDALLQVWRNAARFDPARGNARAWLVSLVRYRALDAVARTRREVPGRPRRAPEQVDPDPDPLDRLLTTRAGQALHRCLAEVGADRRQLVVLAFIDGLSHSEVAARVGQPLGTVKSSIRRALYVAAHLSGRRSRHERRPADPFEDDSDLLAGEYVLGVLPPEQARALEALALQDQTIADSIAVWQDRLAPLALAVEPRSPPPVLWRRLALATGIDSVIARRARRGENRALAQPRPVAGHDRAVARARGQPRLPAADPAAASRPAPARRPGARPARQRPCSSCGWTPTGAPP